MSYNAIDTAPDDDDDIIGHHHGKTASASPPPPRAPPVTTATYVYAACAALNSINLGYDVGVSTNVGPLLMTEFGLTARQLELFIGCINFWSIFGALISPTVTDHFGRRTTFASAAIGFIIGVFVMAAAPTYAVLLVGRTLVGLGVGVGVAIDPMYIAELAPAHVRGQLASWPEAGIAGGVVLGFMSSLLGVGWRVMLALGAMLPSVMLVLVVGVMPESPRWLMAQERPDEARRILQRIYPAARVDDVMNDMHAALTLERAAERTVGWHAIVRPSRSVGRMLLIGVSIGMIQQLSGIDAITFYLMFVVQETGIRSTAGQNATLILLGCVKLGFVFVGAHMVDVWGRRPLLFTSLLGCATSLLVVSLTFVSDSDASKVVTVIALAVYLAFFSIGLGPLTFVIISEVFATSIRAKATSVAVVPNRVMATVMSSSFLSLAHALTWPGFFAGLASLCVAACIFLYIYLPETKGKTLEAMSHYFAEVTGDRSILDLERRLEQTRQEMEKDNEGSSGHGKPTGELT